MSPCYNEAEVIGLFYDELGRVLDGLPEYDFEVILVDDGSANRTLEALNGIDQRDRRVRVASFSRNFGHQIALTAGLDFAAGDAVIMTDSDLQHPPALIPRDDPALAGGARHRLRHPRGHRGRLGFQQGLSRSFYWLINALSAVHIPQGAADFCPVSRRVAREVRRLRERHRFLRGMIA